MPDVTVTALAAQNTREHPNRVKGFVETEMEADVYLIQTTFYLASLLTLIVCSYCFNTLFFLSYFLGKALNYRCLFIPNVIHLQ